MILGIDEYPEPASVILIEVIVPPALIIATAVAVVPTPVGPENVTVGAVVNPEPVAVSVTIPTVPLP